MDIVKYKAWDTKNNKPAKLALRFLEMKDSYLAAYNPTVIEIMEFINAYDKNGIELYEYDIIEFNKHVIDKNPTVAYIKWDKLELAYVAVIIDSETDENPRTYNYSKVDGYVRLSQIINNCKKIGNAFENRNIYNNYRTK